MKSDPATSSGWYEVGQFPDIQQGDLLFNVPVPILPLGLYAQVTKAEQVTEETRFDQFDVVVLTQSCDLARGVSSHWYRSPSTKHDFLRRVIPSPPRTPRQRPS